ncbi:cytochrome-c oxidase, subunit VIIa [Exidia glandulosa HHB12029]|uniref:Cytochrome c oxidase subunit 9, mitochondrial n=1 Tax=Exidia glandulosa HHB12029 TaxID=1314781 RepID=A0A165N0W3_EXIGL|nr:cytochrome-c oxidase, subunit VIIa [Exidia glandulosa HHB12029]
MAIPPITGMLRKRFILDLSVSLGLGIAAANAFWYGIHLPKVRLREAFYLKLEQERAAQAAAEAT